MRVHRKIATKSKEILVKNLVKILVLILFSKNITKYSMEYKTGRLNCRNRRVIKLPQNIKYNEEGLE